MCTYHAMPVDQRPSVEEIDSFGRDYPSMPFECATEVCHDPVKTLNGASHAHVWAVGLTRVEWVGSISKASGEHHRLPGG